MVVASPIRMNSLNWLSGLHVVVAMRCDAFACLATCMPRFFFHQKRQLRSMVDSGDSLARCCTRATTGDEVSRGASQKIGSAGGETDARTSCTTRCERSVEPCSRFLRDSL